MNDKILGTAFPPRRGMRQEVRQWAIIFLAARGAPLPCCPSVSGRTPGDTLKCALRGVDLITSTARVT